jgi:DNA (cytosine-5)-methyltransferase 1
MGYDAEWQLLNSKYFVPQNRERIFIVGHLRGERTRQIFPVGELNEQDDTKKLRQVGNIDTAGNNSLWGRVYDPSGIAANLNANGGGLGAKTGLYELDQRIRKLTPVECERLQGFPDNWTQGVSDTQRYKQMGNAVTVPVVEYLARRLE